MIFSRKTILVVGAALLAACGDKVSVQEYTPPATVAKVNSVEVAPATASMLVGETATFTAAVNADAGVAVTVTWSSSDNSAASVSTAGVVTALKASPGVAICAASTVDAGKKGCASVAVRVATATGLTVAPAAATLNIGNTLQLTASVSGATATPTWSSSSAAVTVSTSGLVTAVAATPGAAVCAAAAGFTNCATIVVTGVVVSGVSVTPSAASLNYGQTVQLTASVTGSNTTNTFSWAAGDALVTVSTSGLVTAGNTAGTSSVCATSTQDATKRACAAITIVAPTPVTPATVSINKITATGNTATTVNPTAVAGNIDVTLDVNSGSYTVSKVELLVGGIVAGSQSFSTAQAAALRYAAEQAVAGAQSIPQIVFTVNTGACGAAAAACSSTNFTPTWGNGDRSVQARIYTTTGGTTAAQASASMNLTFANVDGFVVTTSTTGTTALDATNYKWTGGGTLTIKAYPVSYSGLGVGTMTATLGNNTGTGSTCTASVLGTGTAAAVGTDGGWSTTIALAATQSPTAGATTSCNTTFPNQVSVAATTAGGENLTVVTGGVLGTAPTFRWDNVAPPAPTLVANVNGRSNSWINDAVTFNAINGVTTSTVNNWITAAVVDAGVAGTITYSVRVGAAIGSLATDPITNATTLAASATNASYCAAAYAADVLGNKSATPAACTLTFGVDRAAPTIAYVTAASHKDLAEIGTATIGGEFQVTVNDTGLVGNSGMLPGSPVKMTASRRTATATTLKAADGATTVTALSTTGVVAAAPLYTTSLTGTTGAANYGYWTYNATAYDAAGNSASVAARTIGFDFTAPVPGTPSAALTIAALPFTVNTFINEDLSIQDYWYNAAYTGATVAAPAALQTPITTVDAWNAATFNLTNYLATQSVSLPLALQANMAAGLTNLANVTLTTRNLAQLSATSAAFTPTTITPGAAITIAAPFTGFPAPTLAAGVTGVSSGLVTAAVAASPASTTLTSTITGTTATFNNPFTSMDFWMLNSAGTAYVKVGSVPAASAVLTDNGATRTYTFNLSITGASLWTQLGGSSTVTLGAAAPASFVSQVLVLGMNSTGQVGMQAAALTAINVIY